MQCRTQQVGESWVSVIFRKYVKLHLNPVSWLSGDCLRALTVIFVFVFSIIVRLFHEEYTSHEAFMFCSLDEMLTHFDHCSSICYFLSNKAKFIAQIVSKTIIFYVCVNMHQLPSGAYEAHMTPGMICTNNEFLTGIVLLVT